MHPWRGRSRPPQPELPLRDPDAVIGERHPEMVASEAFLGRPVRKMDGLPKDVRPGVWGTAWSRQLARYTGLAARFAEGARYVEQRLVWHLEVDRGEILAITRGTHLYAQRIRIPPIDRERERRLIEACKGRIGDAADLLLGRVDPGVLEALTDPTQGLLPGVDEVRASCTCPNGRELCKHAAAVLQGAALRFAERPQLLFVLRGTNPIVLKGLLPDGLSRPPPPADRLVPSEALARVFDLELARRLAPSEARVLPVDDPLDVFVAPRAARPTPDEVEALAEDEVVEPEPPAPAPTADASASWLDDDWDADDDDDDDMDAEVFGGHGPSPVSVASSEDGEDVLEIGRTDLLDLGLPSHKIQRWLAEGTLIRTSKRGRYQITPEAWAAIEPLLPTE